VREESYVFTKPTRDRYRPWTQRQVRIIDSWPTHRDQLVSVALSPAGDRLALSVGHRLDVWDIADAPGAAPRRQKMACALAPSLTWSPGGGKLAFRDGHGQGRVADLSESASAPEAETRALTLGAVNAMAFTPDGERLAMLAPSLPGRMTLKLVKPDQVTEVLWEQQLAKSLTSSYHTEAVNLAFSPDGRLLACTTGTSAVWVFVATTGQQVQRFDDHTQTVTGVSWIDNERLLSAATDATLRVWHPDDPACSAVVETVAAAGMVFVRERHTALVWSARGELLAWSLEGHPIQLWDRDPPPRGAAAPFTRLAVSAVDGLLALVDAGGTELVLVRDWDRAVSAPPATRTYANAKILMLGDSGVGKSGLAMVLAGEEFRATESTHARRIWPLPGAEDPDSTGANRDVLLWDLAGQPGYRIVHQLHLPGAALALILFDAKSETAPLAGVQHWARSVRHAHPAADGGLTTFLVAARADRGGNNVSNQRIEKLMADFGLDAYFRTSAKEGTNVDLLRSRITAAIDWTRIHEVTSTALFAAVKQFVVDQKTSGQLLAPAGELCRAFQTAVPSGLKLLAGQEAAPELPSDEQQQEEDSPDRLISVFEGCIVRLESVGLVKRLKFGNYVLLQPELLDTYAGAIVNAARDEPDGLGSILEAKIHNVDFAVPSAERVPEEWQERLLVLATLEELLQHELALRETTEDGVQLVFPAAYRRDLPASRLPKGDGVVFRFEGPVQNIYATLIVRLTRTDKLRRVATWQSAARFAADIGECTVALKFVGEGEAELLVGYERVPDDLRKQFERFVHAHLERRATPGSVSRERQYSCPADATAFTPEQVHRVIRRGRLSILCPVCEGRISLIDDYETNGTDRATAEMDASADAGREIAANSAVLRGKEEVEEYDVFLSYNWRDKDVVRGIAQQLRDRGLRPWLDERQLRPGFPWQQELEEVIARIPAAAVIIGAQRGPWQNKEMYAFMQQSVSRNCAIVPVLLPDASTGDLPVFLQGLTWVDLAVPEPDPIDQLVWGVTGQQGNGGP
jgi:GTPase SAR1 family protein/nucleotide-binding universal stress UspA family protein